ncbi:MAG: CinA family protein [Oscillospiraceae bacterium]
MTNRKQTLASEVLAALEARNWSLATAESCTGGGVGQALTAVPGSSKTYRGGIISYTNSVKSRFLGVPETLLRELGAVSGPVAEAMARGAREAVSADVAVSTTGLAGPGGDEFGNPVGTVWIYRAWPGGVKSVLCRFQGNRDEIREAACCRALELLLEGLQG